MAAKPRVETHLGIAHVLFIDVVGYSKLLVNEQREVVEQLNRTVRKTPQFRKSEATGKLIRIPVGDGMALVFFDTPEEPVQCAMEIARALRNDLHIRLRMGVHSGPVDQVWDVNDRSNVAGVGINIAQRVMNCGDSGHILLSKRVADDLAQDQHWQPHLHNLGDVELKHGVKMGIVNLYTPELGNPQLPDRFNALRQKQDASVTARAVLFHRKTTLVVAAVLLAGAFSIGFWKFRHSVPPKLMSFAAPLPEKSIAVLPFENLSADPENAYFADGTQNEILTKLAGIGDLKVISRSSTAKYKSKPEDLKTVARELGVATVLEGSVQKAGDKVRVNVQLLDARIDTHLWAKSYDRDLKDVFAVESEVAQEIADTLRAKLSPSQSNALAAAPTRDTEAYDLFLRGEYQEHQAESTYNGELFDRAETFYRQALTRDPSFALAYARLAYSRLQRHWSISPLTSAQLEEVKSNIEHALAIAPASPDAHLALAVFYYRGHRDYDSALRELDRTVELQPNNSEARALYAFIYRRRGEWRRSLAEFERAAEVDPRDSSIPTEIGNAYLYLRRWSDAEHALTRALALDPHHTLAALSLANTYINSTGDIRRARRAWEGVPADNKLNTGTQGASIAGLIEERVYLNVLEKRFADALKAWDTVPTNTPDARLRQLEARVGIQVLAGQNAAAKSECEQTRTLLEAQLAERRPEDRTSLMALAWVYICLGRNADALRVAQQAADSLPIERDAISGPNLLIGLAQIEAHTGRPEEAVKILRRLLTIPAGGVISTARVKIDPVWDPIRDDPGFQKLLSEPEPETIYK
jgi:TolB-like protein/Flp pilus assembly protein TadD